MKELSGLTVHSSSEATASTGPGKPRGCGMAAWTVVRITGSSRTEILAAGVSTTPGTTALSGMPAPAHSSVGAAWRIQWLSARLLEP